MSSVRPIMASKAQKPQRGDVVVTDVLGRTHSDALARFARNFLEKDFAMRVPQYRAQYFFGGVTGLVLLREPPFQVELFIAEPNVVVPPHRHPNVDSYELFLRGVELMHEGLAVINRALAEATDPSGLPRFAFSWLRVMPNELHGGRAGPEGGAFLSIQHWLGGTPTGSVGTDWDGATMGDIHSKLLVDAPN